MRDDIAWIFFKVMWKWKKIKFKYYTEFNDAWIDQSKHTSFKVGFVHLSEVLYIVECLTLDSEDPTHTSYDLHRVALDSLHIHHVAFSLWHSIDE